MEKNYVMKLDDKILFLQERDPVLSVSSHYWYSVFLSFVTHFSQCFGFKIRNKTVSDRYSKQKLNEYYTLKKPDAKILKNRVHWW